jgi:hippurate hydrolase
LALGGSFACTSVRAQPTQSSLPTPIRNLHTTIDADAPWLIEIFKDLHANPELGFMETRSAGIVKRELKANGF